MQFVEEFRVIPEFPRYSVSNYGRVRNERTGRIMAESPNQFGDFSVGLTDGHGQFRRSVRLLVARAFVEGEDSKFNTAMLLDGNKRNLRADNIVWRPRWFAWEYTRQFNSDYTWYESGPIIDDYGVEYETVFSAAVTNGELCVDIYQSLYDRDRRVFPFGRQYQYM